MADSALTPPLSNPSSSRQAEAEAPSVDPKEAVPSTSTFTTTNASPPPRSPSPNKCSICLGELVNKCYTNSCCHQYCFGCLLEWSKIKAECPLCKSSFRSIYHNIRSMADYDEYHVPMNTIPHLSIRLTTSDPYAQILGADINLRRHEMDHGYSSALSQQYIRDRFERIRERDPRVIRILEVGPVSERRAFDAYMNSASSLSLDNPFYSEQPEYFGSYHDGTSATATSNPTTITGYQNRRRIYDRSQWVLPFHSTLQPGTVFFPSVEYFSTHPTAFGRINSWLHRELTVLLGLSRTRTEMGFVYDLILGLLLRYDIRSPEFREMIKTYFGARVKHFQHEFYHFVLSGMRAESYDAVAAYNTTSTNGPGSAESRYVGPPPVVTLEDSDDDVIVDEVVVIDDDDDSPEPESTPSTSTSTSRESLGRDDAGRSSRPRRPLPSPLSPPLLGVPLSEISPRVPNEASHLSSWRTSDFPNMPTLQREPDSNEGRSRASVLRSCRRESPSRSPDDFSRRRSNAIGRHSMEERIDLMRSHMRQLRDRPSPDADFPILNLRSRPRARPSQTEVGPSSSAADPSGLSSTHRSAAVEALRLEDTSAIETGIASCLRRGRDNNDFPDTGMTTLQLIYGDRNRDSIYPLPGTSRESPARSSFQNYNQDHEYERSGRRRSHRSRHPNPGRPAAENSAISSSAAGSLLEAISPSDNGNSFEASCSLIGGQGIGVRISLQSRTEAADRERSSAFRRPNLASTLLDAYLDRPIQPKTEVKPNTLKTENSDGQEDEDNEECLFVGIHPVVKKPPLAVITISSEDEEESAGPGPSKKLKPEKRENNGADEFDNWSSLQQSQENDNDSSVLAAIQRLRQSRQSSESSDERSNIDVESVPPSPARRVTRSQDSSNRPSTSAAAAASYRAMPKSKQVKSKEKVYSRPTAKSRRPKRTQSKEFVSSSSSSDSENDSQKNKNAEGSNKCSSTTRGRKKLFIRKLTASESRKRSLGSVSPKSCVVQKTKRFKPLIRDSSTDSSSLRSLSSPTPSTPPPRPRASSSSSANSASAVSEESRSDDDNLVTIESSRSMSIRAPSHSPASAYLSSSSSASSAVDLRTRSVQSISLPPPNFERRWESGDDEDNSVNSDDFRPMVYTENLSNTDSDSVASVSFANLEPDSPSPVSRLDREQAYWNSAVNSPVPDFESLPLRLPSSPSSSASSRSSSSTQSQTEDEAGLNARGLREISPYSGGQRLQYLQSIAESYNASPIPVPGMRYSVVDPPPPSTSGLDLRLSDPWRQYLRSTNSLDDSNSNSTTGLDGYWSATHDWMA